MCFLSQMGQGMQPVTQMRPQQPPFPNFFNALFQAPPPPTGPLPPAQPGPRYGLGGEMQFFPKTSIFDFQPPAPAPKPKALPSVNTGQRRTGGEQGSRGGPGGRNAGRAGNRGGVGARGHGVSGDRTGNPGNRGGGSTAGGSGY